MANITVRTTKAGDKRYRVRVRIGGENVVKSFGSLKAAKSFIRETEGAIETGEFTQPTDKTLGDAIKRYRRDVLPEKAESTRVHQDRQLTWWDAQMGSMTLDRITPALIVEYRDHLTAPPTDPDKVTGTTVQRGASGPTANRYTAALSHVLTMAVQWMGPRQRRRQDHQAPRECRPCPVSGPRRTHPAAAGVPGVPQPRSVAGGHAGAVHRHAQGRSPRPALGRC